MQGFRRIWAVALTAAAVVVAPLVGWASEPDAPGSRDPFAVERFPRSWIVEYQRDDEVRERSFVMSRVDRIRRNLRVGDQLQVSANLEAVTYRIPDGATVAEVISHYREVLGGDVLFQCGGRDCGRSNDWANQVFEQAILYGPDSNQYYAAFERQDLLVALYGIERGNKRVYAHLRFLEPRGEVGLEPNALLARRLAERGWAIIEGVQPAGDGSFAPSATAVLAGLGNRLTGFAGEPLYLVCHLYGAAATGALLPASQRCAEAGARIIAEGAEGGDAGEVPGLEPFGAGPLLPRTAPPASRLELVRPGALGAPGASGAPTP